MNNAASILTTTTASTPLSGKAATTKLQFLQDKLISDLQSFEYAAKFDYSRHLVTGEKITGSAAIRAQAAILKTTKLIKAEEKRIARG